MNLVKATSSSYIDIDKIESVFEDVREATYGLVVIRRVRCVSGETYDISKEAYETILKYGKAEI